MNSPNCRKVDPAKEDVVELRQRHRDAYTTTVRNNGGNVPKEDGDRWWPGTEETPRRRRR